MVTKATWNSSSISMPYLLQYSLDELQSTCHKEITFTQNLKKAISSNKKKAKSPTDTWGKI